MNVGFGRRYAEISCALDSSMFTLSASSVGLLASKRSRTFCQVKGCGAGWPGGAWATPEAVPSHSSNGYNAARLMTDLIPTSVFNGTHARGIGTAIQSLDGGRGTTWNKTDEERGARNRRNEQNQV